MYIWDSNILRHFGEEHPTLFLHLGRVPPSQIALPSVTVAEVLRGRCERALKAEPEYLPFAHTLLAETLDILNKFRILQFDEKCCQILKELKRRHKSHKRYADMMIAATALAGNHTVVTRNEKHFKTLLPKVRIANWIDEEP